MNGPAESKIYLELCQRIAELRSGFVSGHGDEISIPEQEIQKRREEGQPFLDVSEVEIEEKLARRFLDDLLPLLEKHEAFDRDQIRGFPPEGEKTNLSALARSILSGEIQNLKKLSNQYQLSTDLLLFVGLNLSQVMLQLYAHRLKQKVDQENWLKGNCPVCGSHPAMDKLRRDDGKRILRCSFCSTEWHFKRIMCPFCGNEEQGTLRYFFIEEGAPIDKPAFRVDVCDKCKSYIKTLDERKLPESEKPDLYLENLNTLYLDVLAQRDGYQSPTYWMIGPSEDLFV